jgi:flagellar motor switch protein FliN
MSTSDRNALEGSAQGEIHSRLAGAWAEGLAQVFESLAGVRPGVRWMDRGTGPADSTAEGDVLWLRQRVPVGGGEYGWIGAPGQTWERAGVLTLKSAGLETVDSAEARNTWIEIIRQSFSALVREAGSILQRELAAEPAVECDAPKPSEARSEAAIEFPGEAALQVWFVAGSGLIGGLSNQTPGVEPAAAEAAGTDGGSPPAQRSYPALDLLLQVELPVSISFGKKQIPLHEVLKLTTGSIVELDRDVDEPVDILVNQCLIARGEVVVVEGNYGVRIREVASRQDRLRSVR